MKHQNIQHGHDITADNHAAGTFKSSVALAAVGVVVFGAFMPANANGISWGQATVAIIGAILGAIIASRK